MTGEAADKSAVPSRQSRFRGCLLAGAIGDALGAGVEFDSLEDIRRRFGPDGITSFVPVYGRLGAITDDTQMTLFTAEGFIRGQQAVGTNGDRDVAGAINQAYLRWLATQDVRPTGKHDVVALHTGWLFEQQFLHARRAPGNTCISALWSGGAGTAAKPLNNSKGCGGVMRVAPIGLAGAKPFALGSASAALTHGHPSGYLASGAMAQLIASLVAGESLAVSVGMARDRTAIEPDSGEVLAQIDRAIALAESEVDAYEAIAELGQGWVAEEALGISVFCALVATGIRDGIVRAVNHDGDSDSTGAITGNILGALWGEEALPLDLLDDLEGHEVIQQIADDLAGVHPVDPERYPPH